MKPGSADLYVMIILSIEQRKSVHKLLEDKFDYLKIIKLLFLKEKLFKLKKLDHCYFVNNLKMEFKDKLKCSFSFSSL